MVDVLLHETAGIGYKEDGDCWYLITGREGSSRDVLKRSRRVIHYFDPKSHYPYFGTLQVQLNRLFDAV
jgi:hypothetical protein